MGQSIRMPTQGRGHGTRKDPDNLTSSSTTRRIPSMPYPVPRVQIVPQADDQVSFQADGQERLRWHAAARYPRPFFFPLLGPSGRSLTRMGHPAAPDHSHHRSFWWGHHDIGGVNFWEERGGSQQVRQEDWIHYQN